MNTVTVKVGSNSFIMGVKEDLLVSDLISRLEENIATVKSTPSDISHLSHDGKFLDCTALVSQVVPAGSELRAHVKRRPYTKKPKIPFTLPAISQEVISMEGIPMGIRYCNICHHSWKGHSSKKAGEESPRGCPECPEGLCTRCKSLDDCHNERFVGDHQVFDRVPEEEWNRMAAAKTAQARHVALKRKQIQSLVETGSLTKERRS